MVIKLGNISLSCMFSYYMDLLNLYRARIGLVNCAHKKQVGNGKKLCSSSLIELYIIEMLICYCLCNLFYLLGMDAVYDVMKVWYLSTVICESLSYLTTPCYIKGSTILLFMLLFISLIMLLLLLCRDIHTNPGPHYVYEDSSTIIINVIRLFINSSSKY